MFQPQTTHSVTFLVLSLCGPFCPKPDFSTKKTLFVHYLFYRNGITGRCFYETGNGKAIIWISPWRLVLFLCLHLQVTLPLLFLLEYIILCNPLHSQTCRKCAPTNSRHILIQASIPFVPTSTASGQRLNVLAIDTKDPRGLFQPQVGQFVTFGL